LLWVARVMSISLDLGLSDHVRLFKRWFLIKALYVILSCFRSVGITWIDWTP
jgi:hypothetical protein